MFKSILKGFSEELLLIVELLIYLVVTHFVLALTYVGMELIASTYVGMELKFRGELSDTYRLNPFMLILGHLLFTALTVICSEFLLRKKHLLSLKSKGLGWFIIEIILLLITGVLLFFDAVILGISRMGLLSRFEYSFLTYVQFFYPPILGVGYPLVRTLLTVVKEKIAKKKQ